MRPFTPTVRCSFLIASLILIFSAADIGTIHATPIGRDTFGSEAVVESFEGLSPGANSPQLPDRGFLKPGVIGQFSFRSGATLTGPIPNPGVGATGDNAAGVLVGDFSIGPAVFGLGVNGIITSANDIPDGTAFLALDAHPGPIEFTFASDMVRVGALEAGGPPGFVTLSAFDGSGRLLEAVTLPKASQTEWATTFIGLENAAGIRKVTFSDSTINTGFNTLVLDDLIFEPLVAPVPAPHSILLLAAGMTVAGYIRFRRKT